MATATAIANEFLNLADAEGRKLTQMQLQKLVYIANGWSLALADELLVDDIPEAWDYGPVYSSLWRALRKYGRLPVTESIKIEDENPFADENGDQPIVAELSKEQTSLIRKVFDVYGKYHAFQLSAMTHEEGTPWHKVFVEQGIRRGQITFEAIKNHFQEIANKQRGNRVQEV